MRIVFIGTGDIGLPVLRSLLDSDEHELVGVVTQPDQPVGRRQVITPPPVKAALPSKTIPVLQPSKIKSEQAVADIGALAPDVIVVMAYGQILPRAVLELPRVACLNLHASLLPRHRGAAPIQAAIMAGDAETGITVMYIDKGLDTGDILLQSRIDIAAGETGGSLHSKLAAMAPVALNNALAQLANGNAPRIVQDQIEATYAPKLQREDGLIDWGASARTIERKIRAYNPWPGAFTIVKNDRGREQKLKIFSAKVLIGDEPGTLAFRAADALVAAGEAQLEGSRPMLAAELLRGHPWLAESAKSS